MPVPIVLRFHLGKKLNEFGRLTDSVQKRIAGISRIEVITGDRRFSQPVDRISDDTAGLSADACEQSPGSRLPRR